MFQAIIEKFRSAGAAEATGGGVKYALDQISLPGLIICAILLVLSSFSIAVIVTKLWSVSRARRQNRRFLESFRSSRNPLALYAADQTFKGSPMASVYRMGSREIAYHLTGSEVVDDGFSAKLQGADQVSPTQMDAVVNALERGVGEAARRLESSMSVLATTVNGAPFLGLLGTVWGVMQTFAALASVGNNASLADLAPGVSAALLTTLVGLLVAIPAMFAYNFLASSVRGHVSDLDNFAAEFVGALERSYVDHGRRFESLPSLTALGTSSASLPASSRRALSDLTASPPGETSVENSAVSDGTSLVERVVATAPAKASDPSEEPDESEATPPDLAQTEPEPDNAVSSSLKTGAAGTAAVAGGALAVGAAIKATVSDVIEEEMSEEDPELSPEVAQDVASELSGDSEGSDDAPEPEPAIPLDRGAESGAESGDVVADESEDASSDSVVPEEPDPIPSTRASVDTPSAEVSPAVNRVSNTPTEPVSVRAAAMKSESPQELDPEAEVEELVSSVSPEDVAKEEVPSEAALPERPIQETAAPPAAPQVKIRVAPTPPPEGEAGPEPTAVDDLSEAVSSVSPPESGSRVEAMRGFGIKQPSISVRQLRSMEDVGDDPQSSRDQPRRSEEDNEEDSDEETI